MKPIIAGALVTIASLGLLSACADDVKVTSPTTPGTSAEVTTATDVSLPDDVSIPDSITIPAGVTIPPGAIPSDLSIPQEAIDRMVASLEANGLKVDKACLTELLKDDSLRKVVAAGGTPPPEVLQQFLACVSS